MTMRVMTGFDWLPASDQTTAMQNAGWSFYNNGAGRSTDTAFGYGYSNTTGINSSAGHNGAIKIFNPLNNSQTVFWAERMKRGTNLDTNGGPQIVIGDVYTDRLHLAVRLISFGRVALYRGTSASGIRNSGWTLIGQSDADLFNDSSWVWIECKAYLHPTAGTVEVRLNGETILNFASIRTINSNADGLSPSYANMGGYGSGGSEDMTNYHDDFAIWDDLGSTCNDWMGTNRIKTMAAIADGYNIDSIIGGTSPALTHWQSVLMNKSPTDETKFVYIPNTDIGGYDLYDMDPVFSAPLIHCLQTMVFAKQDDATQLTMRTLLESGGTTVESADIALNQSYTAYYYKAETDPATGVGWTESGANAIQLGFKLQASA